MSSQRSIGRRRLLIGALLLAMGAAAIGVAAVALRPPGVTQPGPAGAGSSGTPASSEASPSQPSAAAEPVGPSDFGWASALWMPPQEGPPVRYSLQAGSLDDGGPVVDVEAPLVTTEGVEDAGRTPVFARTLAGVVSFVADSGRSSQVVRTTVVEPDAAEVVVEIEPIVWAMALEADGSHAYLQLVGRNDRRDAGVVRVALDGSREITEILPPAAVGHAPGEVALAAVVGFRAWLLLSPDDRHLLRRVCADPGGRCTLDVLELESGAVFRPPDSEAFAVAGGVVYWKRCEQLGCRVGATTLDSGEHAPIGDASTLVAGWATLVDVDGDPMIAFAPQGVEGVSTAIVLLDPETGEQRDLLTTEGQVDVFSPALDQSLHIVSPTGWLVVTAWGPNGEERRLGVRASDGVVVELPAVPWRMPAMPQPQG